MGISGQCRDGIVDVNSKEADLNDAFFHSWYRLRLFLLSSSFS